METGNRKIILVATVQSHIGQFHKPLMKLLKENGWEIHVAARDNLSEKDGLRLEYPDQVFDIPFQRSPWDWRNLKAYRQLKSVLASQYYDVVHCNTPVGGILARLAARKYRKKGTEVYYTAHGFHFYRGAPLRNWLFYYPIEKLFAKWTDKLITVNKEDYALAKAHFACPVYHIHGVGANTSRYYPVSSEEQMRIKEQLNLTGTVLMTAGELLPNKNQRAAILALKELRKTRSDAVLLVAGNGPERLSLERFVQEQSLMEAVLFLGYTTCLPKYLQACDVFLSCSYREGLPLNILEAMLCGKPVVASDNRGHRELIQNGINGYLVNPDNTESVVEAVLKADDMKKNGQICAVSDSIRLYTDINVQKELQSVYGI